jgi:hypothetical protein
MASQEEVLAYIRQQAPHWVAASRMRIVMADPDVNRKFLSLAKRGFVETAQLINRDGNNERIVKFKGETKTGVEF